MQENVEIQLSKATITALKTKASKCEVLLIQDLKSSAEEICGMLTGYYTDDRGEVYSFEAEKGTFVIDKKGILSIYLYYDISYYFGCDDMNKHEDDGMTITLTVDYSNCSAIVEGEEWPDRIDEL